MKENRKMLTCNRLDLKTLGSQSIMRKKISPITNLEQGTGDLTASSYRSTGWVSEITGWSFKPAGEVPTILEESSIYLKWVKKDRKITTRGFWTFSAHKFPRILNRRAVLILWFYEELHVGFRMQNEVWHLIFLLVVSVFKVGDCVGSFPRIWS